jgi:hypothetical protein
MTMGTLTQMLSLVSPLELQGKISAPSHPPLFVSLFRLLSRSLFWFFFACAREREREMCVERENAVSVECRWLRDFCILLQPVGWARDH